jgi:hypothetical protein
VRKKTNQPRVRFEGHGDVLFTKGAVASFATMFEPALTQHTAKHALVRLAIRTRVVHKDESMHGLSALAPDGVDVMFYARKCPGLAPLICTRVGAVGEDEYDGGEAPRRAA